VSSYALISHTQWHTDRFLHRLSCLSISLRLAGIHRSNGSNVARNVFTVFFFFFSLAFLGYNCRGCCGFGQLFLFFFLRTELCMTEQREKLVNVNHGCSLYLYSDLPYMCSGLGFASSWFLLSVRVRCIAFGNWRHYFTIAQ
jgi:hypothetical protein